MESFCAVELFRHSLTSFGLAYGTYTADGDSGVERAIRTAMTTPYQHHNVLIQKIDCVNHKLRSFIKQVGEIIKRATSISGEQKKNLIKSLRTTLRFKLRAVFQQHADGDPEELGNDLRRTVFHFFNLHEFCTNCHPIGVHTEITSEATLNLIKIKFTEVLYAYTYTLIRNWSTNLVECFNGVVAMVTGGKRINFSLRDGWKFRFALAVLNWNELCGVSYYYNKIFNLRTPVELQSFIVSQIKHRTSNNQARPGVNRRREIIANNPHNQPANEYGVRESDMETVNQEVLFQLKRDYLQSNTVFQENANSTVIQYSRHTREEFLALKRFFLFSDDAASLLGRQQVDRWPNVLNGIIYQDTMNRLALQREYDNVTEGLRQFVAIHRNRTVERMGLVVKHAIPWLISKIHGRISTGDLLFVQRLEYDTIDQAIANRNAPWLSNHDPTQMYVNSNLYRDIQISLFIVNHDSQNIRNAQLLHVTNEDPHIVQVNYDPLFMTNVRNGVSRLRYLENFYFYQLLECVNPRHERGFVSLRVYNNVVENFINLPRWRDLNDFF